MTIPKPDFKTCLLFIFFYYVKYKFGWRINFVRFIQEPNTVNKQ